MYELVRLRHRQRLQQAMAFVSAVATEATGATGGDQDVELADLCGTVTAALEDCIDHLDSSGDEDEPVVLEGRPR